MYSVYAGDYMEAISRLPALEAAHPALFRKAVLGSGRPLVSFLIMPIQRTPRYALLLREVVKHTPEDDPEHEAAEECLQKMQRIVTYINKVTWRGAAEQPAHPARHTPHQHAPECP